MLAVPVSHPAQSSAAERDAYERYMPLVRRIAMRTARSMPPSVTLDDLISAGWVGMAEALRRRTSGMDEQHFEAYASYRVRGAILDYLRMLDPLTRKLRGASRKITEAAANLGGKLGRAPSEDEIAGELGVTLGDYHQLLTEISEAGFARLELSAAADTQTDDINPEAQASRSELIELIANAVDRLPERLKLVLGLHYQEECTLREIGEVLGVTESRACQLHAEAVHLLRAHLERPARGRVPGA